MNIRICKGEHFDWDMKGKKKELRPRNADKMTKIPKRVPCLGSNCLQWVYAVRKTIYICINFRWSESIKRANGRQNDYWKFPSFTLSPVLLLFFSFHVRPQFFYTRKITISRARLILPLFTMVYTSLPIYGFWDIHFYRYMSFLCVRSCIFPNV